MYSATDIAVFERYNGDQQHLAKFSDAEVWFSQVLAQNLRMLN
jgi:hypothetical protein